MIASLIDEMNRNDLNKIEPSAKLSVCLQNEVAMSEF